MCICCGGGSGQALKKHISTCHHTTSSNQKNPAVRTMDWFESQWEERKIRNLKSEATIIVWTSRTFGMQPPERFWKNMKRVVWTLVNILTDAGFIPQGRGWRFYIRTAYCSMLLSFAFIVSVRCAFDHSFADPFVVLARADWSQGNLGWGVCAKSLEEAASVRRLSLEEQSGSVRQRRVFAVPHGGSIKLAFRRNLSKPQPVAMCGQLVPGACQCFVRLCWFFCSVCPTLSPQ